MIAVLTVIHGTKILAEVHNFNTPLPRKGETMWSQEYIVDQVDHYFDHDLHCIRVIVRESNP